MPQSLNLHKIDPFDNLLGERSIHTVQLAYTSRPGDYPVVRGRRRMVARYVLAFDSTIRAEILDDMLDLVSVTDDAPARLAALVQRLEREGVSVEWGGVRQTN